MNSFLATKSDQFQINGTFNEGQFLKTKKSLKNWQKTLGT